LTQSRQLTPVGSERLGLDRMETFERPGMQ
jgi:hypothetical protein